MDERLAEKQLVGGDNDLLQKNEWIDGIGWHLCNIITFSVPGNANASLVVAPPDACQIQKLLNEGVLLAEVGFASGVDACASGSVQLLPLVEFVLHFPPMTGDSGAFANDAREVQEGWIGQGQPRRD